MQRSYEPAPGDEKKNLGSDKDSPVQEKSSEIKRSSSPVYILVQSKFKLNAIEYTETQKQILSYEIFQKQEKYFGGDCEIRNMRIAFEKGNKVDVDYLNSVLFDLQFGFEFDKRQTILLKSLSHSFECPNYANFSIGSLSTGMGTPYSDFEYIMVVQDKNPSSTYFADIYACSLKKLMLERRVNMNCKAIIGLTSLESDILSIVSTQPHRVALSIMMTKKIQGQHCFSCDLISDTYPSEIQKIIASSKELQLFLANSLDKELKILKDLVISIEKNEKLLKIDLDAILLNFHSLFLIIMCATKQWATDLFEYLIQALADNNIISSQQRSEIDKLIKSINELRIGKQIKTSKYDTECNLDEINTELRKEKIDFIEILKMILQIVIQQANKIDYLRNQVLELNTGA